jgi:hypothetical protein
LEAGDDECGEAAEDEEAADDEEDGVFVDGSFGLFV